MRVDANDGLAKFMRCGVGQESEDVALVEAGLLFDVGSLPARAGRGAVRNRGTLARSDERLVLRLVDVLADERLDVDRRINVRGKGIFFQKLAHQFDPATSSTWPSASTARHR